jgi:hypothetical protein
MPSLFGIGTDPYFFAEARTAAGSSADNLLGDDLAVWLRCFWGARTWLIYN